MAPAPAQLSLWSVFGMAMNGQYATVPLGLFCAIQLIVNLTHPPLPSSRGFETAES